MIEEIVKVVEHYGLLPTINIMDKFKIRCPFHSEETASCYVDSHRGTFYCFGCGAKGDSLRFVQMMEDVNSLKALHIHYKILKGSQAKSSIAIKKTQAVNINVALKEAKIYFYSLSKPSWDCIKSNYLIKRGFKQETLAEHDIKINPETEYGVICPIKDCGRFRGYVKRRTDGRDGENKYLYNKGFRRKLVLMGDYNLGGWVVITEGYMDWLKLKQNGIDNATAIFGWEILPKQIEKLKQHTTKVISALDNTPTGEAGTELLKNHFEVVRFQFPENCKDVGELSEIQFNRAWLKTRELIKMYNKNKKRKRVK